jgi:hypothetical protein
VNLRQRKLADRPASFVDGFLFWGIPSRPYPASTLAKSRNNHDDNDCPGFAIQEAKWFTLVVYSRLLPQ